MKLTLKLAGIATIVILLAACHHMPEKLSGAVVTPARAVLLAKPFRYHKTIEVAPGEDFDIFSWGKGDSTQKTGKFGSLLILHTDSVNKKYTTTTGDLDGNITDVFNSDMDIDGNPELLIEARAKDTIDLTTIYAYEFTDNKANKLDFPKLIAAQKKGYRGADNFFMKDARLIREFPVYDGNTKAAKLTGQKRVLQYNLRNNSLTVKDLSADTLKTTKHVIDAVIKNPVEKKPEPKHTENKHGKKEKKKSHHVAEKKKKRKHRR